jgi:chemotaxis signal transduction protein
MSEDTSNHWHLDKRVPIALIVVIMLQTVTLGVWVGSVQERVARNERDIESASDVGERLARVETLLETIIRRLDRE